MKAAGYAALGIAALAGATTDVRAAAAPPAMPGPFHCGRAAEIVKARARDAAELEARCEGCHEAIAAEHRASLHRAATTDASFAKALAIEPLAFCRGCHAPEADPSTATPPALASIGVGCVSCHVTSAGILAAPRRGGARAESPHPVVRDARFATDGGCAGCHEFDFPRDGAPERMQRTIGEHRASAYADVGCSTCHLPRVDDGHGGHASHAFAVSRDPAFVKGAVDVAVARSGPTSARVTLSPNRIGHAFPTGDLFRRVTVEAEAIGDDYALLARDERHLARHFGLVRGGFGEVRSETADDRIGPGSRDVELDLGEASVGAPIHVTVRYERVGHPSSRDGETAVVEGAIDLAEVLLPPPRTPH